MVVTASLLAGGWDRLLSPLVWQADRGLQIEAVPASVPMALRAADPAAWQVGMSHYQAFELFGPGVDAWLVVSAVLGVLGLVTGLALLAHHLIRQQRDRQTWVHGVALSMVAIIAVIIVVNTIGTIVWLGGPLVALVAWLGPAHRAVGRLLATLLVIAALSHLVYPVLYDRINGMADDPVWTPIATVVLVLRNLVLVLFTVDAVAAAWRTPPPAAVDALAHRSSDTRVN